ncbi:MAG: caspase family protein [Myxococcota bacterium]
MIRRIAALLLVLLVVPLAAHANQVRFGIFVGNDEGLPGDPELVFAELDAVKMRDLFVEFGGIKPGNAVLLQGATAHAVVHEFERITADTRALMAEGHEVDVVFYYSGHGDADGLHLGATRLEHEELRNLLERTGAQVRLAMVDACQSGGLVRSKGGQRGPTFAFAEPVVESVHGTAIITSSAASELSQESDEIGGGFFTHYLHTALTGAADRNHDGEVDLSEAYAYVHAETSFRTKDAAETQTPSWDLDLAGAGDVVLTTLEEASAKLSFLGDLDGTYSVWDESRKRYVAQVDGGTPVTLAVRPGTFYVHRRQPGWVEEARYTVRRAETHSVLTEDFVTVAYQESAARGDLARVVKRSNLPDLSLRFVLGYRTFTGGEAYFGPQAIGGFEASLLGKRTHYATFDLRTGGGVTQLAIPGLAPIESIQTSTSLGAAVGFTTKPNLVRAGFGGRSTFTVLTRRFPDWDVQDQARGTIGAGFDAWIGLHHGRFTGDLQLDWQLLVMKWDDLRGWPTSSDLVLVFGYRF